MAAPRPIGLKSVDPFGIVVAMLQMQLRNTTVKSIPVIELYRQDIGHSRLPMVMIYHGFESSKERKLQHAYIAASKGFFVVLPDAVRHGEREDTAFAALSYEQKAGFLFDIVSETALEIDKLLDHYSQQSLVDIGRCGLMGSSMGGMLIYEYLARFGHERLKTAGIIISSPDFGSIIDNSAEQNPEFYQSYSKHEAERVKAEQPLSMVRGLKNFPLLLLNAEDDPIMPINRVRDFYSHLHRHYTEKEALRMKTYHETGHQTTLDMMNESVEWMQRFLMEAPHA